LAQIVGLLSLFNLNSRNNERKRFKHKKETSHFNR
jgi:hypothetical protein